MAMTHSAYNEQPNPTAEYRAYWSVLNKRMTAVHKQGFAITSNLLKAIMLDNEKYLRKWKGVRGLGAVINELESRGIEGIDPRYLKERRKVDAIATKVATI